MENDVRKQEKIYTPEEVAAYLSDMTLAWIIHSVSSQKRKDALKG